MPQSRWHPEWRRAYLQQTFGAQYIHLPALGNRNYRSTGGPIVLADYPTGLQQARTLLSQWPALILLCTCSTLAACHRLLVAAHLAHDLGERVEHLALQMARSTA